MRRLTTLFTMAAVIATPAMVGLGAAASPAAAGAPSVSSVTPDPWTAGTFQSLVKSTRFFDSRYSSLGRPLKPGETVSFRVNGRLGLPSSGVAAVVVNLTVTGPTADGNIVAVPKGAATTGLSSLNFVRGDTRANLTTVPVSSDGWLSIRNNSSGSVHAIVDVQGFYLNGYSTGTEWISGCDFIPLGSIRVADTRTSSPLTSGDVPQVQGDTRLFPVRLPERLLHASAIAVTVTVVRPTGSGYLTLWEDMNRPSTSNVNYRAGQTTTNAAVIPSPGVRLDIGAPVITADLTGVGSADVVIDVNGTYDCVEPGLVYRSVGTPKRIVDSRIPRGTTKLGEADTHTVTAPSTVATSTTKALVANTTAVRPTATTYLSVWAQGRTRPAGSNLNPSAGQTVAGMTYLPLSDRKQFNIYNNRGATDVLVDVTGRFETPPPRG
jgi:hypothetical protein